MTRADFFVGLLLFVFFAASLWEGSTFQYGSEFSPGPGFAPVWLSAGGLCVSLLIAAHGLRATLRFPSAGGEASEGMDRPGLVRVALTLLGLAAMILLVEPIGLVLAITMFLLYLTLIVQRHSLAIGTGASLATVGFVYVVFVYFLAVPIPKGPLGL